MGIDEGCVSDLERLWIVSVRDFPDKQQRLVWGTLCRGNAPKIKGSSGPPAWYVAQDCTTNPYGDSLACTSTSGWTSPTQFTRVNYAGYEYDPATGLYHMRFRYYNPRIGRFMGGDLHSGDAGSPQSLNRMGYVVNDPVNLFDPLGLDCDFAQPETDDSRGCLPYGGGGSFVSTRGRTCSLDGIGVPCDFAMTVYQAGGAVPCPNYECRTPRDDHSYWDGNAWYIYQGTNWDPLCWDAAEHNCIESKFINYGVYFPSFSVAEWLRGVNQARWQAARNGANAPITSEKAIAAIHDSFATFPTVCSYTASATLGSPSLSVRGSVTTDLGGNSRANFGGQWTTPGGIRYQLGTGGVNTAIRIPISPAVSASIGFAESNGTILINSVGISRRTAAGSLGVSANIGSVYGCK